MLKKFNSNKMTVGFDEKVPPIKMLFVALQHVLAVFGGIVAAPLIIAMGMQLSPEDTAYLVSASLVVSGLATLLQIHRVGPVGSGLLSIQGTSFTFIGPLIFAYYSLVDGYSSAEALGLILGTCGICALCMVVLLQFVEKLQRWVSANVSGATVILIGLSLVWVTCSNLFNAFATAQRETTAFAPWSIFAVSAAVFAVTLALAFSGNALLRIVSITGGLILGLAVSWSLGMVDTTPLQNLDTFFFPSVNYFSLGFDLGAFFILFPVFFISASESLGDLSATAKLSGFTIGDKPYWRRIRGGLSGDAINSFIAAILCSFPNTTFSQNNGVIRLTGVCNPKVGIFVALLLIVLGVFPIVGALFVILPVAVLSGATLLMFMMVVVSGIDMVNSGSDASRSWPLVGLAIIVGILSSLAVKQIEFLPQWLTSFMQFPVSTGAFFALLGEFIRSGFNKSHSKMLPNSNL
ncbi:MAG: xanthine/uracil permease [Cellvibrionaceae bacterium]|nr:xanthine/uracil permease [Cellvibrionaceae bacterium]